MMKNATCLGLWCAAFALAQSFPISNTQVFVDIRPAATLAWQGDSAVVVKVRLSPGTQARVWADESCATPALASQMIPASGTAVIPIAAFDGAGKPLVCLSSSDGRLNVSLAALHN